MRMFVIALTFLATLGGCDQSARKEVSPLLKVNIAFTYQPQSTLVHVAIAKGYFVEENVDVQPQMHTYGKAALQSVLDGSADIATVAETPLMFSVLKGAKVFVLANIESSNRNNGLVANGDAGIKVPADLQGKRIGFTPGTTSDFFLDSLLNANGMVRDDVVAIALKPEEMQDGIMSRKIDAASVWNYPLTQIMAKLGPNGHVFYDPEIYTETFNLAAQQEFTQKNPELIKRCIKALIKAEDFVKKNPDEAQAIMESKTNVDRTLIKSVWNSFRYHVRLDRTLLITLEDETRWAIKNHLTETTDMPDYLNFIYPDLLREIKPEAIIFN